jgi:hypothetical protein
VRLVELLLQFYPINVNPVLQIEQLVKLVQTKQELGQIKQLLVLK